LPYCELHALGAGSTQFSANNDFATLGTTLHDETEHTVAGSADSETIEKFVS